MLVPPLELESNVALWLSAVSQYKARVTFCSYSAWGWALVAESSGREHHTTSHASTLALPRSLPRVPDLLHC